MGLATGALGPFFVIFDLSFAVASGVVGGLSGALLGAVACQVLEMSRRRIPLAVLFAAMAAIGSLWGAMAGVVGGATGTMFQEASIPFGFIVGGTTGMVALGLFFPLYLLLSVRDSSTWPAVAASVQVAPLMGWFGLAALGASLFGLWLFALPVAIWAAVALDRVERGQSGARRSMRDGRARSAALGRMQSKIHA